MAEEMVSNWFSKIEPTGCLGYPADECAAIEADKQVQAAEIGQS